MDFIMSTLDYYKILGVGKGANVAKLKSAYRKMAMKHHPDQNPDDPTAEERFKEVNEAWEVLKDPQKKSTYDRKYKPNKSSSYTQNTYSRNYTKVQGRDIYYEIAINLEDAFKGGIIEMDVPHNSERIIKVRVPAGVKNGDSIILTGYGEQIVNGTNGNLRINIVIENHTELFVRDHNDIHTTLRVKLKAGKNGVEKVKIPTIDGNKVELNIPKNTPSGTKFRLRGRGMSIKYSSQRGDMIVTVFIDKEVETSNKKESNLLLLDKEVETSNKKESNLLLRIIKSIWS